MREKWRATRKDRAAELLLRLDGFFLRRQRPVWIGSGWELAKHSWLKPDLICGVVETFLHMISGVLIYLNWEERLLLCRLIEHSMLREGVLHHLANIGRVLNEHRAWLVVVVKWNIGHIGLALVELEVWRLWTNSLFLKDILLLSLVWLKEQRTIVIV